LSDVFNDYWSRLPRTSRSIKIRKEFPGENKRNIPKMRSMYCFMGNELVSREFW